MRPTESHCRSAAVLLHSSSGRKQPNQSHRLLLITTAEDRQAGRQVKLQTPVRAAEQQIDVVTFAAADVISSIFMIMTSCLLQPHCSFTRRPNDEGRAGDAQPLRGETKFAFIQSRSKVSVRGNVLEPESSEKELLSDWLSEPLNEPLKPLQGSVEPFQGHPIPPQGLAKAN